MENKNSGIKKVYPILHKFQKSQIIT